MNKTSLLWRFNMEDYSRHTKEELVDFMTEIDSPVRTFDDVVVKLCEVLSCENCPVVIWDCDRRSARDKAVLHIPCCTQLKTWLLNEMRLIEK